MPANTLALSPAQIDSFIADGFVRIDEAFPRAVADDCRAILWSLTGCEPDDPEVTDPKPHSHAHRHEPLVHTHPHYPDIHHRHGHE